MQLQKRLLAQSLLHEPYGGILPPMLKRVAVVIGILIAALALLVFFAPKPTYAHGAGLTLTSTTTDYMVDVDYDAYSIVAGENGRFDFKLFKDAERMHPVDFTKVWVRITKNDGDNSDTVFDTIFSGWIARATFGSTGMSITLAESGSYQLVVRYNSGDNELVETTLPFTVDPNEYNRRYVGPEFWAGGATAAFLIGLILVVAAYIRATRRRS